MDIFPGSVDRERFLQFLCEQVVRISITVVFSIQPFILQAPRLNPFPAKRSVVILDNCSIHHDEEIRQLIEDECGQFASYFVCTVLQLPCLIRLDRCCFDLSPTVLARLQSNRRSFLSH
jgi:hypothetical protein